MVRVTLVALALVAGACSGAGDADPQVAGPSGAVAQAPGSPPCTPAGLEERAARVLLVGLPETTSADADLVAEVSGLGVGGVLLTHANVETRSQVDALVSALRAGSDKPILVAADEEPGRVRTFAELWGYSPSARRMAAEKTVEAVQEEARITGSRLSAMGVTIDLAPVADLDGGPWNGIVGDRSFSADPVEASQYTLAYARGLSQGGVIPVIKHFPGHGRATDDSHIQLPEVNVPLAVLRSTDLLPFADAVSAGAPVVMMGHVAYEALDPGVPASVSPAAYKLLRELGFKGAAITDSVGMGAVNLRWDFDEAAVVTVAAGADGVLATDGRQARRMRDALVTAVQSGRLDENRLNQAAGRMMALAGGDPAALSCTTVELPAFR